jgi:multiple sugar transport system permease protein
MIESRRGLSRTQFAWLLVAPAIIIMLAIILIPLVRTVMTSFQKFDLTSPTDTLKYVGFKNYRSVIGGDFFKQLGITMQFSVCAVGGEFILGLLLALFLNRSVWGRPAFRAIFLVPWVIPTVVCALLWSWILNVQYGVLNFILRDIGIIREFQRWLGDPKLALWTVTGVTVWKWFPFDFVMLLAALQTVPSELLDAASVDGAGPLRKLWNVTIPSIQNIISVVLVLTLIWSFQEFTLIWGTTRGGPMNVTSILPVHIYRTAFVYLRMGRASAAGVLWMLVLLVFSVFTMRAGFRELR